MAANPQYPTVPNTPGVPPVLRQVGQVINDVVLLTSDAEILIRKFLPSQWGIFTQSGAPAIDADSLVAFEFHAESRSSDYPIEPAPGTSQPALFMSYNKVRTPKTIRVTLTKTGSSASREVFLAQVEACVNSINLYSVQTPQISYSSLSLNSYSYTRSARAGAQMLTVEIVAEEIRLPSPPQFSNTALPSGQNPVNQGTVQGQTPTPAQQTQIAASPQPPTTAQLIQEVLGGGGSGAPGGGTGGPSDAPVGSGGGTGEGAVIDVSGARIVPAS